MKIESLSDYNAAALAGMVEANTAIAQMLRAELAMLEHAAPGTKGALARVRASKAIALTLTHGAKLIEQILTGASLADVGKELTAWVQSIHDMSEAVRNYVELPEIEYGAALDAEPEPMFKRDEAAELTNERRLRNFATAIEYADQAGGRLEALGPGIMRVYVPHTSDLPKLTPATPRLPS